MSILTATTSNILLYDCSLHPVPPLFQVCPSVFEVPSHYRHRGGGGSRHTPVSNHDEELLQYAIHQSLLESGGGAPGQVLDHSHTPPTHLFDSLSGPLVLTAIRLRVQPVLGLFRKLQCCKTSR